uniref:nuclear body protein SP140-like protein n=1 Tax=Semicossyphus pulcher TaxID=241346 RepID=UPI0037E7AF72
MDPLDFLEPDELLRFFRCHKTEMSCVENPHTFINQLRDHNLVPEDRYKKLSRMKSKGNREKALYELLDWLERERAQHITVFWSCVFKETIMNQYPTLKLLRNSLMDGSFRFYTKLPERTEKEETEDGKRKELSEDEEEEETQAHSAKKKQKQRRRSVCNDEDEEQSGPSSQLTLGLRKKSKKLHFSSPLKKGEKSDIWTWPIYQSQLPVTCGEQDGMLSRGRLAKGEKCIAVGKKWYTPSQFERFSGKNSYKNWKLSIRCKETPLAKLIQEGHLKSASFKGGCKKAKKDLFPSDDLVTVSEDEGDEEEEEEEEEEEDSSSSKESVTGEEGQTEEQPDAGPDISTKVFKVTCGAEAATLHMKRFASGSRGKSIRTETSWVTPMEFVKSCQMDSSWRKAIECEGKPLSSVITENWIHSLLCSCSLCKPDSEDMQNRKNDDECFICKSEEEEELVVCDQCPRSFHQKCHLPLVDDAILGDPRPWMCTFCVFRTTQLWLFSEEQEREAVMSRQISRNMLGCQYLLLFLCSADEEQTFVSNPRLYLKDYSTVIKTPMWLENITDKLQKQLYQTVGEFVSDVQLIFSNCASYNQDNAEFLTKGNRLKEQFDRELKTVFKIRE